MIIIPLILVNIFTWLFIVLGISGIIIGVFILEFIIKRREKRKMYIKINDDNNNNNN